MKRVKPKKPKVANLSEKGFFKKLMLFFSFKMYDSYRSMVDGLTFEEYGTTMYCGRQGAGKTISMTEYLERMRLKYPDCLIVTNYGYKHQDYEFKDWNDFFDIRNGTDGVIFAIDEIQNEFSSAAWNKFPESLLTEITQQRKQRIKIVCSSQVYTRVAKPLREQCNDVVECWTFAKRWTFEKCVDAYDYNDAIDSPTAKKNIRRLYRRSFVQDGSIRTLFDSYQKIEKISKTEFADREKRMPA